MPIPSDYVTISTAGIAGITLKAGVTPFVWEWSTVSRQASRQLQYSCSALIATVHVLCRIPISDPTA